MGWSELTLGTAAITVLRSCNAQILQGNVPFKQAHSTHTTTTTTSEVAIQYCLDQCNVIADIRFGWVDGCRDLDRIPSATDEESCRLQCCHDPNCEVWQFGGSGCWTGKAHHCNTKREDITFTGGQMISHGTAEVLDEDFKAPCQKSKYLEIWSGTTLEKRDRCHDKCMANRKCTYWQLSDFDRCYYGDYLECDAELLPDPSVKFGERIAHVCRSSPASATLAATASPEGGDFGFWQFFFILMAFFGVSLGLICVALNLMVGKGKSSKSGDDGEESAEEDDDMGTYVQGEESIDDAYEDESERSHLKQ
eukprot:gnl/MRDRNA2_/MRDRNA2_118109_c0_seq1.p1 gnl/MRDRNA2_/MRDRNA2_118109_c0~~gnl/MRDRNA2_/MRDRNA2_118109_c0_seq1.p1  ORF type:complete len:308 (-),score=49.64 gnl/MRDRNA2_/MRDRNA2_118109_c0_seq1:61-984(-)